MANEKGLDLMLVSSSPAKSVCKLINYGQYKYQLKKKERQSKKVVRSQISKEIKMSPKISEHDYKVRYERGVSFLSKGYKVKLTVLFKGREMLHQEFGMELAKRYAKDLEELGTVDGNILQAKRSLVMILNPK
jgi:translation initiation factor IF-3